MVEEQIETNRSSEEKEDEVKEEVVEEEEDAEATQEENPEPEQDPEQDKIKPVLYIGLLLTSLFALGKIWLLQSDHNIMINY